MQYALLIYTKGQTTIRADLTCQLGLARRLTDISFSRELARTYPPAHSRRGRACGPFSRQNLPTGGRPAAAARALSELADVPLSLQRGPDVFVTDERPLELRLANASGLTLRMLHR